MKTQIQKILKKHNIIPAKIIDKSKGQDNKVYLIYSKKGNYCLRIPIKEKNKIIAQSWSFKKMKKLYLSVPKIIHVNKNYMIEELIKGTDMQETKLSSFQKQKILFNLGKQIKKMHTIETKDFGYLKKPGRGNKKSWKIFIEPDFLETLKDIEKHKVIIKKLINKAKNKFKENKHYLDIKSPKLIHGDLAQDNIIVNNGKLSGIIDSSDAQSGDPYYDLAIIKYNFGKKLFEYFLKGYGNIDMNKIKFYLLYHSTWKIAANSFFIKKNKRELKKAIKIFKETLK